MGIRGKVPNNQKGQRVESKLKRGRERGMRVSEGSYIALEMIDMLPVG